MFIIFKSNIENNLTEIRVVRTIGVRSSRLFWLYFYETLALIFTVTIIGVAIGWVLSLIIAA